MSLSCECDVEIDGWWFYAPKDFSKLQIPRKRCCDCKTVIKSSETCVVFNRSEYDEYGEYEIELEPWYMCERCGEIYLTLEELGYCLFLGNETMEQYLKDYQSMTGFKND